MRFTSSAAAIAVALTAFAGSQPAQADAGDALLGGVAGFAVGTIFGNATAAPRYPRYYPGTVYVAPAPPPPPVVVYQPQAVYYAPAPWTPEWYSYCARKYDSFDPRSGTYLGYEGFRHMCQ